jgi:C-terminal processing protease CtpA/Prc
VTRRAITRWLVVGATALPALGAVADPGRGVFGLTVAVTAEGLFNPTVQVARVARVDPALPAAKAGIAVGDQVLVVDGKRIPGAKAGELAPLAQGKRAGEQVALVLARADGSQYAVQLTAVRPGRP